MDYQNILDQVIKYLGPNLNKNLQILTMFSKSQILDALNNGTYNQEARLSWKLGCHRSVAGTPTHIVNGIKVNDSWEMGYDEWVAFLKNYFNLEKKEDVISIRNPN